MSPSETSAAAAASALTFAYYLRKSRWEGGSFVLEFQTGGGSWASGNPVERNGGLKNDPIHRECVDFLWNNPICQNYVESKKAGKQLVD